MRRVEIININGEEIEDQGIEDELQSMDIHTHCQNSVFYVGKDDLPLMYQFLIDEKMIDGIEEHVLCCMWGT